EFVQEQNLKLYKRGCLSLLLILLFLPLSGKLYADEGVLSFPLTPDKIVISGNKRSKDSFVKKLVIACSGEDANTTAIKACLEENGPFNDVEVTVNAANKLEVQLQDQWTFLAFPVINSGEEDELSNYGFFLFDSNAGGRGDFFLYSYNYELPSARSSSRFIYGFQNLGPQYEYGVTLLVGHSERESQQYSGIDLVYAASAIIADVGVTLSQSVNFASLSYSLGYESSDFNENEWVDRETRERSPATSAEDELVTFDKWNLGFGYQLAAGERKDYYDSGLSFSQNLQSDFYDFDNSAARQELGKPPSVDHKLATSFYLGVPSVRNQVFQVYLNHEVRQQENAYGSYKIGGGRGARGIPISGLWGRNYATLALEYQIPVLQRRSFIWTVSPFFDSGSMSGIPTNTNPDVNLPNEISWNAGGIATYFYFRRVAIPAIGIAFSANDKYYTSGTMNVIIGGLF
ncbi:MAG: hypothetical protein K0U41_00330, partial [Gammaproteobacteria bacterium]|nr:hypothetical protein [Gammaproteobacteria bacterium]